MMKPMNYAHVADLADTSPYVVDHVFKRIFWLYGLHSLLANTFFLIGYYWLPEGFMRSSPQAMAGQVVAAATSFWSEFALTLLFNIGLVTVISLVSNR
jgi:hypothetical protein